MPKHKKKAAPAEPAKPEVKIEARINPLAPHPGDEYHVVLTRHELYTLIHQIGGSIQHVAQAQPEDMRGAIALQNMGERASQLAGFLMSHPRPTLH